MDFFGGFFFEYRWLSFGQSEKGFPAVETCGDREGRLVFPKESHATKIKDLGFYFGNFGGEERKENRRLVLLRTAQRLFFFGTTQRVFLAKKRILADCRTRIEPPPLAIVESDSRRGRKEALSEKKGANGSETQKVQKRKSHRRQGSNARSSSGGGDGVSSTSDGPTVLLISSSDEVAGARKLTGEIT
ncbi:hypothetical protein U1Q18_024338 [Sarracenia purpurea var. burkii]